MSVNWAGPPVLAQSPAHQFDIYKLVLVRRHLIFRAPDVWHIAPVISAISLVRNLRRVVNEAINARGAIAHDAGEIVDHRLRWWVPTQVDRG